MTNVVKKGAGRPAHVAKVKKHAQRTPLPPRGKEGVSGKGVSAKVLKDELEKQLERKAKKTAAKKTTSTRKAVADKKSGPKAPAKGSATPSTAKNAAPEVPSVGLRSDVPGAAKVAAWATYAAQYGWTTTYEYANEHDVVAVSTKDDETIRAPWFGGKQLSDFPPMWHCNGRSVSLRNVGGARGHVDGSRAVKRGVAKRAPRKSSPNESEVEERRLDVDLNSMSESELLAYVAGKTVTWKVPHLPPQEDTVLPVVYCPECYTAKRDGDPDKESSCHQRKWKEQRSWKVEAHPHNGKRIFHFTSAYSLQYRAVYVDAIVGVS